MKLFKIGDWVFVNSPSHALHGKMLLITGQEQYTDLFCDELVYRLKVSGGGTVLLSADRLSTEKPDYVGHEGHEVVENSAGGKTFLYCRKCKTEVL